MSKCPLRRCPNVQMAKCSQSIRCHRPNAESDEESDEETDEESDEDSDEKTDELREFFVRGSEDLRRVVIRLD